jgi:hypothetical protein
VNFSEKCHISFDYPQRHSLLPDKVKQGQNGRVAKCAHLLLLPVSENVYCTGEAGILTFPGTFPIIIKNAQ